MRGVRCMAFARSHCTCVSTVGTCASRHPPTLKVATLVPFHDSGLHIHPRHGHLLCRTGAYPSVPLFDPGARRPAECPTKSESGSIAD